LKKNNGRAKTLTLHHHKARFWKKVLITTSGLLVFSLFCAFCVMYERDLFPTSWADTVKFGRGALEGLIAAKVFMVAVSSIKYAHHKKRRCPHCKQNLVEKIEKGGKRVFVCVYEFCKKI